MHRTKSLCLLALLALAPVMACRAKPPHREENPGPIFLNTRPPEARVVMGKLELYTPCNLPEGTSRNVNLEISKPGFATFKGRLKELTQVGINSYERVLVKE
jgi:hypothetical protein